MKLGNIVWYDYQVVDWSPYPDILNDVPPEPTWLRNLLGDEFLINVVGVHMNGTPTTDTDLDDIDFRRLPI